MIEDFTLPANLRMNAWKGAVAMSTPYTYRTIDAYAEAEIIEKKSRFIAALAPAATEQEAQAFIDQIRKKHYNATHNCFAYRVGLDREISRYGDDGEPQGTAGIPMLNVLAGEGMCNIAVVITRYFGGTLLGTGGLVRAYGGAVKEGLSVACIVEKNLYAVIELVADYHLVGKIQHETLKEGHTILDTVYGGQVTFTILALAEQAEKFMAHMIDSTNGSLTPVKLREVFGTNRNGRITPDE